MAKYDKKKKDEKASKASQLEIESLRAELIKEREEHEETTSEKNALLKRQKNLSAETEKSINKIRKLESQLKDAESFNPEFYLNHSSPIFDESFQSIEEDCNDL